MRMLDVPQPSLWLTYQALLLFWPLSGPGKADPVVCIPMNLLPDTKVLTRISKVPQ